MSIAENPDRPVRGILERLEAISDRESLSLNTLITAFGAHSFLPALLVPAILLVSPLSGIPFFSTACGLVIAAIAGQMLAGSERLWIPRSMHHVRVDGTRVADALERLHNLADRLDRNTQKRFRFLIRGPFRKALEATCVLCGLAMPFLELVPFSSSALGLVVVLLTLSLIVHDGLFALLGFLSLATATVLGVTMLQAVAS